MSWTARKEEFLKEEMKETPDVAGTSCNDTRKQSVETITRLT